MKGMSRVLLCGYYGCRNFGDDLLMKIAAGGLLGMIRPEQLSIDAAESGHEYIRRWFPGVSVVDSSRVRTWAAFDARHVLFGGGGTIFEYRSDLGLGTEVRKRASDALRFGLARMRGARFAAIGLGIGPFANARAKRIAVNRLRYFDYMSVRDPVSMAAIRGLFRGVCMESCDLAFGYSGSTHDAIETVRPVPRSVLFVVRHFKYDTFGDSFIETLVACAGLLQERGYRVKWASLQPSYDSPAIERVEATGASVWRWNPLEMGVSAFDSMIREAEVVVTARYHALLLALMAGVASVGISVHQKIGIEAEALGGSAAAVAPTVSSGELLSTIRLMQGSGARPEKNVLDERRARVNADLLRVRQWLQGEDFGALE